MSTVAEAHGAPPAREPPAGAWSRTAQGFGTIVFLASDLMLFAAFFSAYFVLRGSSARWPPGDVDLDVPRAAVATAVLVASSFTLLGADRALERGDRGRARRWLLVTIALGTAFLVNQVVEYAALEFGVDSHPYGSAFWLLTGLHGLHVTAGIAALSMLFVRVVRARNHRRVLPFATSVSAYWHLVDVVWVGVFSTIWLLQ
jgi:cytochrome c oxidase subunit III